MRPANLLIVDSDPGTNTVLVEAVGRLGLSTVNARSAGEALQRFEQLAPAVVILYLGQRDKTGLQLLRRLTRSSQVPVIAVVEAGCVRVAVEAMRDGAFDVFDKHATSHDVEQAVGAALTHSSVHSYGEVFRRSPKMQALETVVARLAAVSTPVLVRGESGVGKEVVARVIHQLSDRSERPFVKLTWAALPADHVVSELETAVVATRDGTLFLDEIGDATAAAQTRLLHIMAGKGSMPRVIAATSADMNQLVTAGVFRRDLYQRLALATIDIPPLRERREEIDVLTHRFLERFSREFQRPMPPVSRSMAELLRSYEWPGNVRELESLLKRWVVLGGEGSVRSQIEARRAAAQRKHGARTGTGPGLREIGRRAARDAERTALQEALLRAKGNRAAAARELKVSYRTLLQKITEVGLTPPTRMKRTSNAQLPLA
jgi:DNA-binding NtrC family response regulator